jgi:hypothetical protein
MDASVVGVLGGPLGGVPTLGVIRWMLEQFQAVAVAVAVAVSRH